MHISQVAKQIKQGEIAPIYVFYGTQHLLIEEAIQQLSQALLDENSLDFNFELFDLEEHALDEVIEAAETLPFLGEKRLVVARRAHFLSGTKVKESVEQQVEGLERYLSQPADYTVLVLVVPHEKLDGRKKVVKLLKQKAVLAEANSWPEKELAAWLKQTAKDHHVGLTEEALALLLQFVGESGDILASELAKMATYIGPGGEITDQIVLQLTARTVEQDVFKLIDQVVHLQLDAALATLDELLRRHEEPVKIVFLLARQFRLIYRVKCLQEQGYGERQISQMLGLHPYVGRLAARQGRPFSTAQLASFLDHLAELDYQLKTGQVEKRIGLELFILRLARKTERGAPFGRSGRAGAERSST